MKKILLITVLFVTVKCIVAQEIRYSLKGGLTTSKLVMKYGGNKEKTDGLISFYLGGQIEYDIAEKMALQGELLYQSFGGSYTSNDSDETIDEKNKIFELSIPIIFKYFFIQEKLSVSGGVSLGFILYGTYDWTSSVGSHEEGKIGGLPLFNYGINLGIEYRITDHIFIDARYNLGLRNLYDGDTSDVSWKGNVFQVGIGYSF